MVSSPAPDLVGCFCGSNSTQISNFHQNPKQIQAQLLVEVSDCQKRPKKSHVNSMPCVCCRVILQVLMLLWPQWKGRKTPIKAANTQRDQQDKNEPPLYSGSFFLLIFNSKHRHRGSAGSTSLLNQTDSSLERSFVGYWWFTFKFLRLNLKKRNKQKKKTWRGA